MRPVLPILLASLCAVAAMPARAQMESREGISLQNQILELRQEVQSLRDQSGRPPAAGSSGGSALGGYPPAAATAALGGDIATQLLERVQRLEDELRLLRGHVDEVDNARRRQGEDFAKQLSDLDFKLENAGVPAAAAARMPGSGPAQGNLAAPGGSDVPPAPPPPPPLRHTPEMLLQEGNTALARHDYAAAEAAARQVLAGKGPRLTDAQFLLAQSLAGRRDFPGAAVAFDDAYNRSRTGSRAQDSLVGLAGALSALSEKTAACQTLEKLRAEFPAPRADLREQITAVRRSAACR